MVPGFLKAKVWEHYRPGQEIDKRPSESYMLYQQMAIQAVAERESGR